MKRNHILLILCLLVEGIIIGKLLTTIDATLLLKNYMKLSAIVLNIGVFIWECILLKTYLESNVPTKSILTLLIVIAANLFFGIYHESFFYTNLVLLGVLFELFLNRK